MLMFETFFVYLQRIIVCIVCDAAIGIGMALYP